MGTRTGTLMPIIPTLTPRWKRRAASPLAVKMAVPLLYRLALMRSMASSTKSACSTDSTGSKISSRYTSIYGGDAVQHGGADEEPFSYPGTTSPRPSTVTYAPCCSPESKDPGCGPWLVESGGHLGSAGRWAGLIAAQTAFQRA